MDVAYFYRDFLPQLSSKDRLEFIRDGIILERGNYHFDWMASALGFNPIEMRKLEMLKFYANTHSNASSHAIKTTEFFAHAKNIIKNALKLEGFEIIHCGFGATAAVKTFQEILGLYISPNAKKLVNIDYHTLQLVVTDSRAHHSSSVSFEGALCEHFSIPLTESGELDFDALNLHLQKSKRKKIIFVLTYISNVTGRILDYEKLSQIAKAHGGLVALDIAAGVESFVYHRDEIKDFDALFLSAHKLLGGVGGAGILCIKSEILEFSECPFLAGGNIEYIDGQIAPIKALSRRFEAGTPGIMQMITTGLAFKLQEEVGLEFIYAKKRMLTKLLHSKLLGLKDMVKIYGADSKTPGFGVISFNIRGISPFNLAHFLSHHYGVQVRAGFSCAFKYAKYLLGGFESNTEQPLEHEFSKAGFLRVSLHYSQSVQEIEFFSDSLSNVITMLRPYQK